MSDYRRHIFFRGNPRQPGDRPSRNLRSATQVRVCAKRRVKQLGLEGAGKVRVNQSGCLDRCEQGPCIVVSPEAARYTYVDRENVDEITEEHLRHGRVVERLRI